MGITSGYCTVGNFGSDSRMEYTIIGNQVNLASRLESNAQPGQILMSEETYTLVRSHFAAEEQPALQVKGISKPVRAWRVVGPVQAESTAATAADAVARSGTGYAVQVDPGAVPADERARVERALREALDALKRQG